MLAQPDGEILAAPQLDRVDVTQRADGQTGAR
jgi:hypothetical protein